LTITFKPDFSIFEPNDFDYKTVATRCRDIAYNMPNLTITLRDERRKTPKEDVFHYEHGMADLVRDLNRKRTPLHSAIHTMREITITPEGKNPYKVEVDIALQFTNATTYKERSYTNTIQTIAGGTHIEGMRAAIREFINEYARKVNLLGNDDVDLSDRRIQRGLTTALSVKHPSVTFESQTKVKLINPEMHQVVAAVVREALETFAAQHPDEMRRIVEQCLAYRRRGK
jgi:DNA gyrase subunit B